MSIFVTALFTHELPRLLAKLIYHVSEDANWSHCLSMEMYQGCPNTSHKNASISWHKFRTRRLKAALQIPLNLWGMKFIQITLKSTSNLTKNTLRSITETSLLFWKTIAVCCDNHNNMQIQCVWKMLTLWMLNHVVHTMTRKCKLSRHYLINSHYNTNSHTQCAKIALLGNQLLYPHSCPKLSTDGNNVTF